MREVYDETSLSPEIRTCFAHYMRVTLKNFSLLFVVVYSRGREEEGEGGREIERRRERDRERGRERKRDRERRREGKREREREGGRERGR